MIQLSVYTKLFTGSFLAGICRFRTQIALMQRALFTLLPDNSHLPHQWFATISQVNNVMIRVYR